MVKVREKKTMPDTIESATPDMPAKIRGMNKHESDKNDEKLYFMALGGLEHVGQNMYVYKYKGKYLVVDCGMGFLEEEIGAGDVQYCDTAWLEKRKKICLAKIQKAYLLYPFSGRNIGPDIPRVRN